MLIHPMYDNYPDTPPRAPESILHKKLKTSELHESEPPYKEIRHYYYLLNMSHLHISCPFGFSSHKLTDEGELHSRTGQLSQSSQPLLQKIVRKSHFAAKSQPFRILLISKWRETPPELPPASGNRGKPTLKHSGDAALLPDTSSYQGFLPGSHRSRPFTECAFHASPHLTA